MKLRVLQKKYHILPRWAQLLFCLVLLSLPVIIFCLDFVLTKNRLAGGDADYLMQLQEALRKSIFEFHQFPWWNPWVSGGVPLFANPQFGLFSITTIFTLLFGSILGYKIALVCYFLIGFWGFLVLFVKAFKTPLATAILLAYIWTFGSFLVHRLAGHYTFFTIQFFPTILYLFLRRKSIKRSWLWLGLCMGLMANTAAHNTTVFSFAVLSLFALVNIIHVGYQYTKKKTFKLNLVIDLIDVYFWLKTGFVFLLLAGYRLFFTLQFLHEYPREFSSPETTLGLPKALFAIFGPFRQFKNTPQHPVWSWQEASAYIGLMTGVVALLCAIQLYKQRKKKDTFFVSPWLPICFGIIFFGLGLGTIAGRFSPYSVLKLFPVFSDMRVASRWLAWASMMVLMFIATYRGTEWRRVINVLLLISVIELFTFNHAYLSRPYGINPAAYPSSYVINQQDHFDTGRDGVTYDENLTQTTKANIGQVIAGDALIDTRWRPPYGTDTKRCDSDIATCSFVLSNNATVVYWSPNKIVLNRTGSGDIALNMNPGKAWMVNNTYPFSKLRVAEPNAVFNITDTSSTIELKLQPKFSVEWFMWKI